MGLGGGGHRGGHGDICNSANNKNKEKERMKISPDWCGSVGWVSYRKVKGRRFDSQSGHMPGLLVLSTSWGA